jgi:hypothetical protein
MCDDAENLAGAGTDVRRCSDALGPRKNLHGRASHRRATHRCVPHGRVPHGRAPYRRVPHGRISYSRALDFRKWFCGFGDFRCGPCEPITHRSRVNPGRIFVILAFTPTVEELP